MQHPPLPSSSSPSCTALYAVVTVTTHRDEHDNGGNEGSATAKTKKKKVKVVRITVNNQHVPPPAAVRIINSNSNKGNGRHTDVGAVNDAAGENSGDLLHFSTRLGDNDNDNEDQEEHDEEEGYDDDNADKGNRRRDFLMREEDGVHDDEEDVDEEDDEVLDNQDDEENGFDEHADGEEEQNREEEDDDDEEEEEEDEEADRVFSRENSSSSDTAAGAVSKSTKGNRGTREGGNFEASLLLHIGSSAAESNMSSSSSTTKPAPIEEQQRLLRERGGGSDNIHDPTTLPPSVTSFLDALTEEQRRVRHRHIPTVDGFRRLYRSEIKSDITLARRSCRKKQQQLLQHRRSSNNSKSSSDECVDGSITPMDVDENILESECMNNIAEEAEEGIADENEDDAENPNETSHGGNIEQDVANNDSIEESSSTNPKNKDVSDAFIVPTREARQCALGGQLANLLENTEFENSISASDDTTTKKKSSASAVSTTSTSITVPPVIARSPKLVDSLTTFNPPRPQESTTLKTLHRMKRWEANPSDIEVDLRNYRKTVCRTQEELHIAEEERLRVESVASLMRNHLMEHLKNYRAEVMAINEGLGDLSARCCKLLDDENILTRNSAITTRGGAGGGGGSGKGMEDVLATLKVLGEKGVGSDLLKGTSGDLPVDWRIKGVGGISAEASRAFGTEQRVKATTLAKGWLLVGDEVIVTSTGDEGIVVSIDGITVRTDEYSYSGKSGVESKEKHEGKKEKKHTVSASSSPTDTDAMDVDTEPPTEKEKDALSASNEEGDFSPSSPASDDTRPNSLVKPRSISIKLTNSGRIQAYTLADIEFNPKKFTSLLELSDSELARRWECMINTALANCAGHDILAMEEYTNSFFVGENDRDADANVTDDGTASPKSVTLYEDERTLLPFCSGLVAAPEVVKNGPSVIPLDNFEETVRKLVCGTGMPRIIPTMPPTLLPYESRKEEINALKGKVLQLRNRLGRQKRLRSLNEQNLVAGKSRAKKVERLLKEMESDLITLKGRLQDELNELGIGNTAVNSASKDDSDEDVVTDGRTTSLEEAEGAPEEVSVDKVGGDDTVSGDGCAMTARSQDSGNSCADSEFDHERKRARMEERRHDVVST